MCVISCIFNSKENLTKKDAYLRGVADDMTAKDSGAKSWIGEYAVLAHSEKELEPVSRICEGYQFVIVFSGTLYNNEEIQSHLADCGYCFSEEFTDAELTLNCYIHFGEKCAEMLSGQFAFVVYDAMRRRVFAATDIFGSVPLFYHRTAEGIVLCSDISGMLAYPKLRTELDSDGLRELFLLSRRSCNVFKNIKKLSPGNYIKMNGSDLIIKQYYSPPVKKNIDTYKTALCKIDTILESGISVRQKNASGIFLSGNPSDELICSSLCKNTDKYGEVSSYSFADAHELSNFFGTLHRRISYNEISLAESIKKTVSASGIPTLSANDFLLPLVSERMPSGETELFCSSQNIFSPPPAGFEVMVRNHLLNPAVEKTLGLFGYERQIEHCDDCSGFLNSERLVAESCGINLHQPHFDRELFEYVRSLPYSHNLLIRELSDKITGGIRIRSGIFASELCSCLCRILLDITEEENCPLLAFFNRTSLYRLCVGDFDFSTSFVTPVELVSYIIKLNYWLLKYKPNII